MCCGDQEYHLYKSRLWALIEEGLHYIIPLTHMEGLFPKDEPSSFKFLVLEPNENFDVKYENQDLLFEHGTLNQGT